MDSAHCSTGTRARSVTKTPVVGGVGDEVEVHATRFGAPNSCDPLFQEGGPVIQQDATPLLRAVGIEKEQIPQAPPKRTAPRRRSSASGCWTPSPKKLSSHTRIPMMRTATGSLAAPIARLMDAWAGSVARRGRDLTGIQRGAFPRKWA